MLANFGLKFAYLFVQVYGNQSMQMIVAFDSPIVCSLQQLADQF